MLWRILSTKLKIPMIKGDDENCDKIIFFVNRPSKSTTTGFMDFNQKYGFVFKDSGANLYTIAHELGHGLGLHHTFKKGSPYPAKGRFSTVFQGQNRRRAHLKGLHAILHAAAYIYPCLIKCLAEGRF